MPLVNRGAKALYDARFKLLGRSVAACPQCGARDVVRIVYGYPSPELWAASKRGEVAVGSGSWSPINRHCRSCGHDFIGAGAMSALRRSAGRRSNT
jgi:hypothetical protein